jgi:hypothetical protein
VNIAIASLSGIVIQSGPGTIQFINGDYFIHLTTLNLRIVKGTSADCWLQMELTIPRYTEGGEWKVISVTVRDRRPNERTYTSEQLIAAGIRNTFTGKN